MSNSGLICEELASPAKTGNYMSDELTINRWLKEHFGTSLDGRPNFRVCWTTGLTEKRHGTFNDFVAQTDILIRTWTGVKEVPKYPFYKDRWVLEKLEYIGNNKELLEKTGYEPLWIFQTADGSFLPLVHRAVAFFMYFYTNRGNIRTPSDFTDEDTAKFNAEVNYFKDFLKDKMSDPNQMDLVR